MTVYLGNDFPSFELGRWSVYGYVITYILVAVAFYLLRSFGLYKLAERKGIKNSYVSFIPFAWIYVACLLVEEFNLFGITFKKLSVWCLVIFSVVGALNLINDFLIYFPLVGYYFQGGELVISEVGAPASGFYKYLSGTVLGDVYVNGLNSPYSEGLMTFLDRYLIVTNNIVRIAIIFEVVVEISLYFALFKKFYPEHYVLASVLSALVGLFPIFVFAIRNKNEINFAEYMRSRYGYGQYGNPYNNGQRENTEKPPENPFKDFAEKGEVDPGDPFSDFGDKGKDE